MHEQRLLPHFCQIPYPYLPTPSLTSTHSLTPPPTLTLPSLPFVISEGCLILLGSVSFYAQVCKYKKRQRARLKALGITPERWPRVDVMVPCFKEPLEVIERTLRAAMAIDWPPNKLTVLLLDDGGSREAQHMVARLAKEFGATDHQQQQNQQQQQNENQQPSPPPPPTTTTTTTTTTATGPPTLRYIARLRKPHEPHHAKAGNLNHALFEGATAGDYVLVLDCDMVPKPDILQAIMPHFFNEHRALDDSVAMVQSPQAFSNTLPGDPLNNNSPLFYHVIIPGWDGWNAAPCCGTNVMFSRKALTAVGGFAYGSVTEDFLTSMTLDAAGYRTRYVDEVLAVGLAPEGLDSFFGQRLRWAVGGLQIFRYFNPLFKTGLSWPQRLLYAWSGGHYLLAFPLGIVLCTPFLFLLDDGRLLLTTGTVREYCWHFFPFYVLHLLVAALAHRRLGWAGGRYLWRSQQEPVFMLFTHMKACLVVGLGLQFGFQVTRKDGKKDDVMRDLANVLPHLIFFVIGSTCFVTGCLQLLELPMDRDLRLAYAINLSWGLLVLCGLWPPIGQFWEVPALSWACLTAACRWPRMAGYEAIPDLGAPAAKTLGDGEETTGMNGGDSDDAAPNNEGIVRVVVMDA